MIKICRAINSYRSPGHVICSSYLKVLSSHQDFQHGYLFSASINLHLRHNILLSTWSEVVYGSFGLFYVRYLLALINATFDQFTGVLNGLTVCCCASLFWVQRSRMDGAVCGRSPQVTRVVRGLLSWPFYDLLRRKCPGFLVRIISASQFGRRGTF